MSESRASQQGGKSSDGSVGSDGADSVIAPTAARPGYASCPGGCGVAVPIGQHCSACAARAVGEWLLTSGRPGAAAIVRRYYTKPPK